MQFLNFHKRNGHKRNWIDAAPNCLGRVLRKFDPCEVLEVKLFGRQLFNQLPNDTNLAIRQSEELRRTSVLRAPGFGRAGSCVDGFTDIIREILPGRAVPLESVGGDHFQAPGLHIALGILHVHMKVCVRVLPIDTREGTLEIQALASVELDGESMVRKRGNPRAEKCHNHQEHREA